MYLRVWKSSASVVLRPTSHVLLSSFGNHCRFQTDSLSPDFPKTVSAVSEMAPPKGDLLYQKTVSKLYFVLYGLPSHNTPPPEKKKSLIEEGKRLLGANEGEMLEKTLNSILINTLESYLSQEERSQKFLRSPSRRKRMGAEAWERTYSALRPSPVEIATLIDKAGHLIAEKKVPLVVATRLMKPKWPSTLLHTPTGSQYHYIFSQLCAWIAEELAKDALSPRDARIILDNMSHSLRGGPGRQLVGPLVEVGVRELDRVEVPGAIIALMWSIHACGTHAPNSVWEALLDRLLQLNETQTSLTSDSNALNLQMKSREELEGEKPLSKQELRKRRGGQVGHVFSGLTTRELYRIVEVLKREKWSENAYAMQTLADAALKNIAFEIDALPTPPKDSLSRSEAARRSLLVADLKWEELLSLLLLCGELGVPFDGTMEKIVESLLIPMVQHLRAGELLELLLVIRRTRSQSASLLTAFSTKLQEHGPTAPYALPVTLSVIKTLTRSSQLLAEVQADPLVHYSLALCELYITQVRVKTLLEMAEVVYGVYRHLEASPALRKKCQTVMEGICRQMDRLLQLEVTDIEAATKLLEYTIVLNMRQDEAEFPNTHYLLKTRNAILASMERVENGETSLSLSSTSTAAVQVYQNLVYMQERIEIIKATILEAERNEFFHVIHHVGLYDLFWGASLYRLAHQFDSKINESLEADINRFLQRMEESGVPYSPRRYFKPFTPRGLNIWVEQKMWKGIYRKVCHSYKGPSPTNEELLQVMGLKECDPKKVKDYFHLIFSGPLGYAKSRKSLWSFNYELAQRFGDAEDIERAKQLAESSLY